PCDAFQLLIQRRSRRQHHTERHFKGLADVLDAGAKGLEQQVVAFSISRHSSPPGPETSGIRLSCYPIPATALTSGAPVTERKSAFLKLRSVRLDHRVRR